MSRDADLPDPDVLAREVVGSGHEPALLVCAYRVERELTVEASELVWVYLAGVGRCRAAEWCPFGCAATTLLRRFAA